MQRGFDLLQKDAGAALLILSTIMMIGFIIAGGMWMSIQEKKDREKEQQQKPH
jgi:hypothetical protein